MNGTRRRLRLIFLVMVLGVAALVTTAAAVKTIQTFSAEMSDPGKTTVRIGSALHRDTERLRVTTTGLSGKGFIDCGPDRECIDASFAETEIELVQDIRLGIDVASNKVRGRTRGTLSSRGYPSNLKFKGRVRGRAACASDRATDVVDRATRCDSLQIDLHIRGILIDSKTGDRFGRLNMKQSGILSLTESDSPPVWKSHSWHGETRIYDKSTDRSTQSAFEVEEKSNENLRVLR